VRLFFIGEIADKGKLIFSADWGIVNFFSLEIEQSKSFQQTRDNDLLTATTSRRNWLFCRGHL
jgi:hypothetical protein